MMVKSSCLSSSPSYLTFDSKDGRPINDKSVLPQHTWVRSGEYQCTSGEIESNRCILPRTTNAPQEVHITLNYQVKWAISKHRLNKNGCQRIRKVPHLIRITVDPLCFSIDQNSWCFFHLVFDTQIQDDDEVIWEKYCLIPMKVICHYNRIHYECR